MNVIVTHKTINAYKICVASVFFVFSYTMGQNVTCSGGNVCHTWLNTLIIETWTPKYIQCTIESMSSFCDEPSSQTVHTGTNTIFSS